MEQVSPTLSEAESSLPQNRSCLPPHVREILYGPDNDISYEGSICLNHSQGLLSRTDLRYALKRVIKYLPWDKEHQDYHYQKSLQKLISRGRMASTMSTPRIKRASKESKSILEEARTPKEPVTTDVEQESLPPQRKTAFTSIHRDPDYIPPWALVRLESACKSARFELPFRKELLEKMTPLEYLARYTRLYRGQRRRYLYIFERYKSKVYNCMEFKNLYPALNSMYGNHLNPHDFEILCSALRIHPTTELDPTTFVGVCTYTDRLFWTAFVDQTPDSAMVWGPNRMCTEVADFTNLKWKLRGLILPPDIIRLLYSLA